MKVKLLDIENKEKGQVDLAPEIFEVSVSQDLLHQVVKMQLAKRRAGTACTKPRGEVRGGGAKPWRQKGSGRARAGTSRSPLWVGGGTVFGPKPRNYEFTVPKKMCRKALKGALSIKASSGRVKVLEGFALDAPKTKAMKGYLANLGLENKKVLLVEAQKDQNILKSIHNIPGVDLLPVAGLNVYDLLWHEELVVTRSALDKIGERLGE